MEYVGDNTYMQRYYSTDFFTLDEVRDYEIERLWRNGVEVIDYQISIGSGDKLIFYLVLFFQNLDGTKPLGEKLFNYKNTNHE